MTGPNARSGTLTDVVGLRVGHAGRTTEGWLSGTTVVVGAARWRGGLGRRPWRWSRDPGDRPAASRHAGRAGPCRGAHRRQRVRPGSRQRSRRRARRGWHRLPGRRRTGSGGPDRPCCGDLRPRPRRQLRRSTGTGRGRGSVARRVGRAGCPGVRRGGYRRARRWAQGRDRLGQPGRPGSVGRRRAGRGERSGQPGRSGRAPLRRSRRGRTTTSRTRRRSTRSGWPPSRRPRWPRRRTR